MNRTVPERRRRGRRAGNQRGFAYIALLIAIVIMGVVLAAVGDVWAMAKKREQERELLFVGGEFRRAIANYAAHSTDVTGRYPRRLSDLLLDPRTPAVQRYLRKLYVDPITGTTDWGLLKSTTGEIYGVYSLSDGEPVKKANFDPADAQFEGKRKYSEWVFSAVPGAQGAATPNTARGRTQGLGRLSPF